MAPAARREAAPAAPVRPASPAPRPPADIPADAHAPWHLGQAQPLYADTARPGGARWLVLAQTTPAALQAPVFDGDAGRLLGNMLRAARLHQDAGCVLWAPLVRQAVSGPTQALSAALSALVAQARPDVVLVMGRLAALALLASSEPFGKLRGRVHTLHGARAVVTCDAAYLLRTPADKARAWDDLCLAMHLAASKA
jgi:DNA polymerase